VPKGPPEVSGVKRLAVAVDDHTLDYIDFEGTIPEGQYGAGKVEIWDKGTFNLTNKTETTISLVFHGKRLEGNYHLIRTKDKNWLIFKTRK
jgi:DNA ligase D-like protein (predicted 3'-phosphoesterase)